MKTFSIFILLGAFAIYVAYAIPTSIPKATRVVRKWDGYYPQHRWGGVWFTYLEGYSGIPVCRSTKEDAVSYINEVLAWQKAKREPIKTVWEK